MIPYELDPSLHSGEPHEPRLDDGFSPPEPASEDPTHLPVEPEFAPAISPNAAEPPQVPHPPH